MFGIGSFELFLILLFGFLVFGPDKLPAMAKTLGKAINKFRSAQEEMNKVIKTEVYDPNSDEPFKNPLEALSKVAEGSDDKKDAKQESFSERKAKYDKERAAKKEAEAKKAEASGAAAAAAGAAAKASDDAKADAAKKPAAASSAKPKPSADELYGTKPPAKKPAASSSTSGAASAAPTSTAGTKPSAAAAAAKPATDSIL